MIDFCLQKGENGNINNDSNKDKNMGILDKIRKLKANKNERTKTAEPQPAVVNKPKQEKSPVDVFIDNIYKKIDEAKFSPEKTTQEALKAEIKEGFSNLSKEMQKEVQSALRGRWENYDRRSRRDDPRSWGASDIADNYMTLQRLLAEKNR